MAQNMKPGGGGRFAALKSSLAQRPGVTDPGALAAAIGRKKFGAARFDTMAAKPKVSKRPPVPDDVETKGPPPPGDPDRMADLAEMVNKPLVRKRGR